MFELAVPRRIELPRKIALRVEPDIYSRGSVNIFALNHTATQVSPEMRMKIFPVLRTCDNLLCEGTSTSLRKMYDFDQFAYERYIVSTFKKKHKTPIHPLEEGCNIFEMTDKYGLDKNEMGTYLLLSQYAEPIINAKSTQEAFKAIDDGIQRVLSIQDNVESLDIASIKNRLRSIVINKGQLPETITDEVLLDILRLTAAIAICYRGFLSEYEYLGPNIKRLMTELPGRKGIVVGKAHLEAVEKALENEEFVQPERWEDFIEKFDPVRKGAIQITRQLMSINA
ncbi:hypothetical protein A2334_04295 [Candidatus Roizmanbacteria bacterium RIFOXYB2_FULL_38_10]|uniref:Uncharacterized protein n=1 Tax=Candidatus Roizmanbacteria bacterium RIFOXYD1_FULL_38_12 TaxID=1802093 RepID=A0A1F7KZK1_9BACT|nr:MAG: hypothetical protein A3K47_00405 [Candidatus Roizmanbacteria bacterium RIFOXYA2_FULL_38_14]OGK63258.1 MAG: hypothetical protein A3K27_00405 [Candidatus Roizmanbacteria bacterium RIFOXYA1_FULL_37_12]OGK65104.1 MAG: hypothetical protein A3K38_00405 [Candidatus Roizmanbacteria bacterium RIFOXYB1_FULL_40_23]OGK68658.1 MAG: hypothetical protein A2334_04295 [Candidatus Roizmanbacteria bacterium RIFOXYB2_FULL_38_10]OGK69508.1 MAG: hypothetical protein A3K21_00405 [Candidatus Roizmanbacteria ba